MSKEIERKFLVKPGWEDAVTLPGTPMSQAYLSADPHATVRVRIAGPRAFLTVKGLNRGAVRDEWEYEIPAGDAADMMERCGQCRLSKTRYRLGRWEVDSFHGPLEGLVVAEIELSSADEPLELPEWIGPEVTGDSRYYNSSLAATLAIPGHEHD